VKIKLIHSTSSNPCSTVEKPGEATASLGMLRRDNEDLYRFEEMLNLDGSEGREPSN